LRRAGRPQPLRVSRILDMFEDYLPEFNWVKMDKKIKKVLGSEKKAVKETEQLLKMDKKQDKKIEKLEKAKKSVRKHLNKDIKESKHSIHEDKELKKKIKKK
jgi:hypothetical protein